MTVFHLFGMMSVHNDGTSEMKIIQLQVGPNDINVLMQIVALQSLPHSLFVFFFFYSQVTATAVLFSLVNPTAGQSGSDK